MKRFPWQTLVLLGLVTYCLVLLLGMWWRAYNEPGWVFTWATWWTWEPWVDAVVLHLGAGFILWRWRGLLQSLWERYRP